MGWRQIVHWTELQSAASDWAYAVEWNYYFRIVCRLLAEGHEGRWVVIKGEALIGFWDTLAEAESAALERFLRPMLLKRVLEWEPMIRPSFRVLRALQASRTHGT